MENGFVSMANLQATMLENIKIMANGLNRYFLVTDHYKDRQ
jgi:hypothetical protein